MGREAHATAHGDDGPVAVRLHVDSQALDVRGGLRRRIPRASIDGADADGSTLRVRTADGELVLEMDDAPAWAHALSTPPPSLADKLGVGADVTVLSLGPAPAPVAAALDGRTTADARAATVVVVTVATADDLVRLPSSPVCGLGVPVWVVHGKGRVSAPGGTAVREVMRAAGFRDTKITAVDDAWSATRYHR